MHLGLIDNANHLFELKCPSFIRIIRAFQWENIFRFPQGSRVFYSADLDLINTSNILTHDLTPVNKCWCFIVDFMLLHFLPAVRLSPVWSSHPCASLCLTWVTQCCGKKTLCTAEPAFTFITSSLKMAPNTVWLLHYGFFWGKLLLQQERPVWYRLFLPQASHTCSFFPYFPGRIETIWCALPHFSKTSSPLPFFFSHTLVTVSNAPWEQNLAQCLAYSGLPRLMMNKWILHPFLIYQVTLLCLHTTSWRGERKSPSQWLKHLG